MAVKTTAGLEGFDLIDDWLASFEAETILACYVAMYESTDDVEQSAKATDSYNDDTGATRNSTLAYVYQYGDDPSTIPVESVAIANDFRPFSASDDSHPPLNDLPPDSIVLDVMSATDYSHFLNTRKANEGAYLELAILENYRFIMDRIVSNVKEVLY